MMHPLGKEGAPNGEGAIVEMERTTKEAHLQIGRTHW